MLWSYSVVGGITMGTQCTCMLPHPIVHAGRVQNWRVSMLLLTLIIIVSAALFFVGAFVHYIDYRPEEEKLSLQKGHKLTGSNAGNVAPPVSDLEHATLLHHQGTLAE